MLLHTKNTTKRIYTNICISFLPFIIFSLYLYGVKFLIFLLTASLASISAEFAWSLIKKEEEPFASQLIPGLFMSVFLSVKTNLLFVFVAVWITHFIGKLFVGGFSKTRFTPICVSLLLMSFVGLKLSPIITLNFLDNTYVYISLSLYLISYLYLVFTKAIKPMLPLFYLGTLLITFLGTALYFNNNLIDALIHTGSFAYLAIYLIPEMSTTPITKIGEFHFGFTSAILTASLLIFKVKYALYLPILIANMFKNKFDKLGINDKSNTYKYVISALFCLILVSFYVFFVIKFA